MMQNHFETIRVGQAEKAARREMLEEGVCVILLWFVGNNLGHRTGEEMGKCA
jgi:hypothetical protein